MTRRMIIEVDEAGKVTSVEDPAAMRAEQWDRLFALVQRARVYAQHQAQAADFNRKAAEDWSKPHA